MVRVILTLGEGVVVTAGDLAGLRAGVGVSVGVDFEKVKNFQR
jgi:hypothetical protein